MKNKQTAWNRGTRRGSRTPALAMLLTTLVVIAACTSTDTPQAGMPNPAAVFCEEQGYVYEIRSAVDGSQSGMAALLHALAGFSQARIIFTFPNADAGGLALIEQIKTFVEEAPDRCAAFTSLGQLRYLSLLNQADAVIGGHLDHGDTCNRPAEKCPHRQRHDQLTVAGAPRSCFVTEGTQDDQPGKADGEASGPWQCHLLPGDHKMGDGDRDQRADAKQDARKRGIDMLGPLAFVFSGIDKRLRLSGRPAGLVQFQRFQHAPDQTVLVIRIQDLERLRQAGLFPV